MKLIFGIIFLLTFALSAHSFAYWTPWLDRDNPSGSGDYELYTHLPGRARCRAGFKPVGANCRVKGSNIPWYRANQNISPCNQCTPKGFACVNKVNSQSCKDYEIRFLCYRPVRVVHYWTPWLDRDNPSGSGDFELYANFVVNDRRPPCRAGYKPVGANCRVKGSNIPWYRAKQKISSCNQCTSKGFACVNSNTQRCKDYEIQFLCYKRF
ncbi:cartilage intermediate layer protein 1-like [Dendronephthya gigantea]|uniref:cartilage intermediate layer protein 1-like n=1 Tax=Dendronephthya gigantea TaxID=151771 RepID=UPI0010690C03|nr:cartilage intermediate layer protein 1-like [Dendronephthya gigantea]